MYVSVRRHHKSDAINSAREEAKVQLDRGTVVNTGLPIQCFDPDFKPNSYYEKWKFREYVERHFDDWCERNNVSEEDKNILESPDTESKDKMEIYLKYKKKRTQEIKDGSFNNHKEEEYDFNNDLNNYSRKGVIIYANLKLLDEELTLSYVLDTGQAILTSNLGRSLAYIDKEIELMKENIFEYFKLKAKSISIGFVNLYATRVITSHAITTLTILPFMDNVSEELLSLLIGPAVSCCASIFVSGIMTLILNREKSTIKQFITDSLSIATSSGASMIYRWFYKKIIPLINDSKLMSEMDKYLAQKIIEWKLSVKKMNDVANAAKLTGSAASGAGISTSVGNSNIHPLLVKLNLKIKIALAKLGKVSLPILETFKPLFLYISDVISTISGFLGPYSIPVWVGSILSVFTFSLLFRIYNSFGFIEDDNTLIPRYMLLKKQVERFELLKYRTVSRIDLIPPLKSIFEIKLELINKHNFENQNKERLKPRYLLLENKIISRFQIKESKDNDQNYNICIDNDINDQLKSNEDNIPDIYSVFNDIEDNIPFV